MRLRVSYVLVACCGILLAACQEGPAPQPSPEPAGAAAPVKNVILMIGDGMGPQQVGQAILYRQSLQKQRSPLALEALYAEATRGDVRTASYNTLVTDSAAAATAMACGVKTQNRVVGLDHEGRPCETVVDVAMRSGRAIGVVTNTDVTDATPAAFLSHVASRDQHEAIARQYIRAAQVDLLLGGGAQYFDVAALDSYQWIAQAAQLSGLTSLPEPGVIGLFAAGNFPYAQKIDRGDSVPGLSTLTREAIRLLAQDPDGFLLLVEGGLIDKAAHANDAGTQLRQLLEFDAAIRVAFDFARRSGDTLLIITADHETGGFGFSTPRQTDTISDAQAFRYLEQQQISLQKLMGPILDKLYGDDSAAGYSREQAVRDLQQGIEQWTAYQLSAAQAREVLAPVGGPLQGLFDYFDGFWLNSRAVHLSRLARILGMQNASTYASGGHTAVPVPIFSWGPEDLTRQLTGLIDNTTIAVVIRRALSAQP